MISTDGGLIACLLGFGMTETTSVTSVNVPEENRFNTCGSLIAGQQARLVNDKDGKDIPSGGEGELWLRGPNVVPKYHNNEAASQNTFTSDGWLKTGDIAYFKDGHLHIVDRSKELIKYKGFQVAPAELEAVLLQSELVADSAVIGGECENDVLYLFRLTTLMRCCSL